jgi:hypothetical protein
VFVLLAPNSSIINMERWKEGRQKGEKEGKINKKNKRRKKSE